MRIALHQPNFLPHLGFFLKWQACDHLLLFDTAQLPDRGYTQRSKVLLGGKEQWLSLPVQGKRGAIKDATIASDQPWRRKIVGSLERIWGEAEGDKALLESLIAAMPADAESLSEFNIALIEWAGRQLGVEVPTSRTSATEGEINEDVSQRIVDLLTPHGATTYLSGPSGRDYLEGSAFEAAGIELCFFGYQLAPYPQASDNFVSGLSLVDILAKCGVEETRRHLRDAATRIER